MYFDYRGLKPFYSEIGSGAPVIVLHGGPALSHEYFLPHLTPLSKHFRLIFLDFSCHGNSQGRKGPTIEQMVDEVEALRAHLHLPAITLLGHSMGGFVAQNYAARHGEHLSRLIL